MNHHKSTPSDPVVVVTGGARGIGAAISCRFADDGATVIVVDLEEPATKDSRVHYEQADISVADDVNRLFSHIVSVHGRVDTLVNNAGIWFRRPFADISVEEWDQVFGVNVRGVFLCTQAVLGSMRAMGGGAIIYIGSQAGLTVTRGQGAHYHASKAALVHLTKVLAFEFGPMGIRVNCVAPSATPPDPSLVTSTLVGQIPLGRVGVPGDITGACAFLASSEAAYITGQTLAVNGGAVAFL